MESELIVDMVDSKIVQIAYHANDPNVGLVNAKDLRGFIVDKGREFWAGRILTYYQWITGRRFEDMARNGLKLSTVLSMYILHEADESKFVEQADSIINTAIEGGKSRLSVIRKARGYTQRQLSETSGVTLRMIQLYEQKQNDINKAQVGVVLSLAKALGCDVEDLLE